MEFYVLPKIFYSISQYCIILQSSEIHADMYNDRQEIVSPGGMPDGKRIQDLNIDDIPSIRRNSIICDLFSRLKLMERRGSEYTPLPVN